MIKQSLALDKELDEVPPAEEAPPFLSTWKNVYFFLVAELALLIVLFHLLTRWAS